MLTHHNNTELRKKERSIAYDYTGPEHKFFHDLFSGNYESSLESLKTESYKEQKLRKIGWATKNDGTIRDRLKSIILNCLINKYTASFYYFTGIDTLATIGYLTKSEADRGKWRLKTLEKKTGENTMLKRDMKDAIKLAKKHFSQNMTHSDGS